MSLDQRIYIIEYNGPSMLLSVRLWHAAILDLLSFGHYY